MRRGPGEEGKSRRPRLQEGVRHTRCGGIWVQGHVCVRSGQWVPAGGRLWCAFLLYEAPRSRLPSPRGCPII